MTNELLIDAVPGELRVALLEDDDVVDIAIDRAEHRSLVGNIYLGRIEAVEPSLQAAFVRMPEGLPGYLSIKQAGALIPPGSTAPRRIERLVQQGATVLVQATRDAQGDKGPGLTSHIALPGRLLVYHPFRTENVLSSRITDEVERERLLALAEAWPWPGAFTLRTVAEGAQLDVLEAEATALFEQWTRLEQSSKAADAPACLHQDLPPLERALRDWARPGLDQIVLEGPALLADAKRYLGQHEPRLEGLVAFHTGSPPLFVTRGVEETIDSTLESRLDLPGGGWITIEPTEALTAIDINSGDETSGADLEQTALTINRRALPVIARQLRLRDIGGMIIIDFIHMEDRRHVTQVIDALRRAVAKDPAPTPVLGMTRMGVCEMTRKRAQTGLPDLLTESTGKPRRLSVESVGYNIMRAVRAQADARPGSRIAVEASAPVIDWLQADARPEALEQLAGLPVLLQARDDLPADRYEVYGDERHD